ncbi:hypothetical protein [Pedobacter sp. MW01-1-1]|uniref:hypothetical protein n=1 Tax=Pedobacter sp. MW01-1-1 TaxID=3383027 RepID=UPI003FEFA733
MKKLEINFDQGRKVYSVAIFLISLFLFTGVAFAQTTPTEDIGWPRQIKKDGGTLVYYQPQIDDWKEYKNLSFQMAFSLTPKGGKPILGVSSLQASTLTDKEARTVFIRGLDVMDVRFSSLGVDSVAQMTVLFKELVPGNGETISLDRVLADLDRSKTQNKSVNLKTDPPQIFYSTTPAIVLTIEGDSALLAPIENSTLKYVVNTNWDVFFDQKGKEYYFLAKNVWLKAKDYRGPWVKTTALPAEFSKLPTGQNFDEVKKMIPATTSAGAPKVFFSNKPAELLLINGNPIYTKITGTSLSYVSNTKSDIFLDNAAKKYYILLSGRWYRSAVITGPWVYVKDKLPADFAKIPDNTVKTHVLSFVPGTIQASDAVLLAQVPVTAIVTKSEVEAKVKVVYNGDPKFAQIDSTQLLYAVNTTSKVVKCQDDYYLCDNAIWFISKDPRGPWKVADSIPKEIYTIPPSSPVYNVIYVTQTNSTETTVESSYTAGYMGMFIFGACIAYGTGWYYPPYMWWGPGMYYPFYNPWPCAWGSGVMYNPWTGGWAAGRAYYGPYGYARSAAGYNPATGRYGHVATAQGWYNGRTVAGTYNPWTGGYAGTSQGHSPYAQWGTSVAGRGNQWIQTGHVSTGAGTAFGYHTSGGRTGIIGPNGTKVVNGKNGTFAGHDGNIYQRDANGNWNKYEKGTWQKNHPSNPSTGGLNQRFQSRQRGQVQTQRFQNFQRGGMGGGFRGGRRR